MNLKLKDFQSFMTLENVEKPSNLVGSCDSIIVKNSDNSHSFSKNVGIKVSNVSKLNLVFV